MPPRQSYPAIQTFQPTIAASELVAICNHRSKSTLEERRLDRHLNESAENQLAEMRPEQTAIVPQAIAQLTRMLSLPGTARKLIKAGLPAGSYDRGMIE